MSHYFDVMIMVLIVLSVFEIILETEADLQISYGWYFEIFEDISVTIFTFEYLLRVWTCVEDPKYKRVLSGRLKFISSPMAIIDLLAILPFYLPFVGIDLRFLRILRLFRVFRLLKMARYSTAFNMIKAVLKDKKEELLVTMSLIVIILIIVSTMMYHVEHDVQPEAFSSIGKSLWWGISTLTTVGYGDIYPITGLGKFLGGVISLLGIGLIALPSGILASAYTEYVMREKEENQRKEKN
jgi:voltage-gated potassium channel